MSQRSSYNPNMDKHWDPMQEAYRDPHFNSYKDGPGANLDLDKQPCSLGTSKEKTMCKLYVGNVPSDIDKDGIENIFRTVAEPVDIMRANQPNNFAFVTFRTFGEAEEARRKFDRRPPMNLKIEYARNREETGKKRQTDNFEFSGESENRVVRKSIENVKPSGKGRGLAVAPFEDPRAQRPGNNRNAADIRQFQQYGGSNYDESNTALLKGVQRDNGPGGPKKFVMGRGCFDRDMDKLCQPKKLEDVIDNLHGAKSSIETYYQKRNGTFEYSKKEYPPNWMQGTCTLCREPSTQFCAQCKDWYCSRTCQEKDWPRHRAYCGMSSTKYCDTANGVNTNQISPPRKGKVKEGKDYNTQQHNGNRPESKETFSHTRYIKRKDDGTKQHSADSDERKPSNQDEDLNSTKRGNCNSSRLGSDESECSFEKEKRTSKDKHTQSHLKEPKFAKNCPQNKFYNRNDKFDDSGKQSRTAKEKYNENVSPVKFEDKNLTMNSSSKKGNSVFTKASPPKGNRQKSSNFSNTSKECSKGNAREPFKENEQLPDSFTKVTIQVPLGPDVYWVVLSSSMGAIASMSSAMASGLTERTPVELGAYCMARYQEMWFRAKITSVQPKLKVIFIDFGNEEIVTSDEIRTLPDGVKNIKAQAIRIKLAPGTSQKYQMLNESEELCVKRVNQNKDGLVTVHVEGEVYEQLTETNKAVETEEEEKPIALQNITVLLKKDMKCVLSVTERNNAEFLACLVPSDMCSHYNNLFCEEFYKECESLPMIGVVPKIGEAVVAKFSEDGWLRAYILHVSSKNEFTVASCDLGLVETVKEIKKLPLKCREIVQFAVECVLEENKSLATSQYLPVVIESCSSDSAIAVLDEEKEKKTKIKIKKWEVPYELYEELRCVELKDGDCVISAEMSPFELYVRPLSNKCIDTYNRLLQDVAKYCFKSPLLEYTPKVGQVLAAQFTEDGNFYRAIVREVNKSKGIKVQYIDFGNVEFVNSEALKPLNKTLRSVECCVVKVVLEGVVDRPLNEEVQKLFKDLILATVTLKVRLSEEQSNKVYLSLKDGTDLNEKINKLLMPGWKKGVLDKQIYTIDDVTIEKLEFNTPLELVIMNDVRDNEIIVRPKRSQTIQVLQNDLQEIISEYCENSQEPYTPRELELCVAKVENKWRRAICFSGGNPLSLYLLDDGFIVNLTHENIRKYLQEFTALPAVGVRCKIKTSKVTHSRHEEITGAIRRYFNTMKVITAEATGKLPTDGCLEGYTITVPELDELLQTL